MRKDWDAEVLRDWLAGRGSQRGSARKNDVLVIVPTRSRPESSLAFGLAFFAHSTRSDLLFALDEDDPELTRYTGIPGAQYDVNPRLRLVGTLNLMAAKYRDQYRYLAFLGDDHRIRTPGWDQLLVEAIDEVPAGIAYGNDLHQGANLPTAVLMHAAIVRTLGYMAPPDLIHSFKDNFWRDLGQGLGALRYRAEVVLEHLHWAVGKAEHDLVYEEGSAPGAVARDQAAYDRYARTRLGQDIAWLGKAIARASPIPKAQPRPRGRSSRSSPHKQVGHATNERRADFSAGVSSLRRLLGSDETYATLPSKLNRPGFGVMMSHASFWDQLIAECRPRRIIEVGSWEGSSAVHIGQAILRENVACEGLICIDTWLGSPEFILDRVQDGQAISSPLFPALRYHYGYPQVFYTFLSNVIAGGLAELITPIPLTSESAWVILKRLGMSAQLIYVDGAHEYESVRRDLRMYWELVETDGILVGDDYSNSEEVRRAADEFAREIGVPLEERSGKFILNRASQLLSELSGAESDSGSVRVLDDFVGQSLDDGQHDFLATAVKQLLTPYEAQLHRLLGANSLDPSVDHAKPFRVVSNQSGWALGNRLLGSMAAVQIAACVDAASVEGLSFPEFDFETASGEPLEKPLHIGGTCIDLDLNELWSIKQSGLYDGVLVSTIGMRLEYFIAQRTFWQSIVSQPTLKIPPVADHEVVIHIRCGDKHRPGPAFPLGIDHAPLPIDFYTTVISELELSPVFVGQIDDERHPYGEYIDSLRQAFPDARFVSGSAVEDFEMIRRATNKIIAISSFSWMAAWLGPGDSRIVQPVAGFLNPLAWPEYDFIPRGDPRYDFRWVHPLRFDLEMSLEELLGELSRHSSGYPLVYE